MQKVTILLIAMIFRYCPLAAQNAPVKGLPNIIFILADDLGYGDIGCYGQQKISTPNINALAKSGMRFTQFYSGSTVCAPARASFMTGLHTGHSPVRGNITIKPEGQFPLPASTITLPMRLKEIGYQTAAFGKWSLGFIGTTGDPQKKGFDHFYGYNCQTLAHDFYPDHLWENDKNVDLAGNPYEHNFYSADLIHSKALEYINRQGKQSPFFVYLPYTLPHADLTVPHDEVYERYVKQFGETALSIKSIKDTAGGKPFEAYPHAAFAAMVSRLDKYVGEIVALINKKGLDKNTLIIFCSDNGPHKEDGGDPVFFNSSAGLRGIKRDLYEGGIRSPFIVKWPGRIKSGSVNKEALALWDIYPTLMEIAGQRGTMPIDGISFLPALIGKKQSPHKYLYWELHEAGGKQAVRFGNFKAVKLKVSAEADPPLELYDLEADPQEKINIADKHPDMVKLLNGIIKQAHVTDKAWPLLPAEK